MRVFTFSCRFAQPGHPQIESTGDQRHMFSPTASEGDVLRSVSHSVKVKGGGESPSPWTETPRTETPHSGQRPPGGRHPWVLTSSGGHCSGGYASYWNIFLLLFTFCRVNITTRGVFYLQKSHYPRRSGISCFLFCIFFDVLIILKSKYEYK